MPSTYAIAPEKGVAYVALTGKVEGASILEVSSALYTDTAWDKCFDMVWDGCDISELSLTPLDTDGLLMQAANNVAAGHTGRIAVVANREVVELVTHLYRHRLGAMGRPMELFKTLSTAARWLSLPEGLLQRLQHGARAEDAVG